ncbi:MAG: hypothetical protein RLZZ59_830 [Pseudomonadota bacterium]
MDYKPDSVISTYVIIYGYLSRMNVTIHLKQPTRIKMDIETYHGFDAYLVLLLMGFTLTHVCYQTAGALLPHLFTLTSNLNNKRRLFSVALSLNRHEAQLAGRYPALCLYGVRTFLGLCRNIKRSHTSTI